MFPSYLAAVALGFGLDLVVGDPHELPHPVQAIGWLVSRLEHPLRRAFPQTVRGELGAGAALVVIVALTSVAATVLILGTCALVSPWLSLVVKSVLCCQMLATKSLHDESMKVYDALRAGNLDDARTAVSMIVGRDTEHLDADGVARAAVETVAENASDGVMAPLFCMAVGGATAAVLYKACNTMDSMVGYRNETYCHFGTAAARVDDVLNFVPARITGILMCLAAPLVGLDGRGAWRVFRRDRRKHASPNAAHTEAACAGALGVRLAGDSWYFGSLVKKPTIGDARRPIEAEDIVRANRLMYATSALGLVLSLVVGWGTSLLMAHVVGGGLR